MNTSILRRQLMRNFILFFTFITCSSCPLFSAYSLVVPNDQIMQPVQVLAPAPIQFDAKELNASLTEFNAFNYLTHGTDEKIEHALVEKLSKNTSSLSALLTEINALIKRGKAQAHECTALIRVYQAAVLQQALKDPNKKKEAEDIVTFIKNSADVKKVDEQGNNALHLATLEEKAVVVQFLLPLFTQASLLDVPGHGGLTALHCAAISGDVENIKALIDAGAQLATVDKNGNSALYWATWHGKSAAVKFLAPLFAQAGLLDDREKNCGMALHYASLYGDVECIKALLNGQASPIVINQDALRLAVLYGEQEAVKFLTPLSKQKDLLKAKNNVQNTGKTLQKENLQYSHEDIKNAVKIVQELTLKELEALLLGFTKLHIRRIKPPFLPLMKAIQDRVRPLQEGVSKEVLATTALSEQARGIVEGYLFGMLANVHHAKKRKDSEINNSDECEEKASKKARGAK